MSLTCQVPNLDGKIPNWMARPKGSKTSSKLGWWRWQASGNSTGSKEDWLHAVPLKLLCAVACRHLLFGTPDICESISHIMMQLCDVMIYYVYIYTHQYNLEFLHTIIVRIVSIHVIINNNNNNNNNYNNNYKNSNNNNNNNGGTKEGIIFFCWVCTSSPPRPASP